MAGPSLFVDKKTNKQRRTGNEASRSLRPAVQHHISLSFTPVEMHIDEDDADQGDEYVDQPDTAPASGHGKNTMVSSGKAPAKTHNPTTGGQPKKSTRPRRQAPTELPEIDPKRIKDFHCDSKLLLIVGAQSKDPDLLNLTRDLAMSVHDGDGAVIYIDSVTLPGAQYDHIDIQLQADIQETLGEVLRQHIDEDDADQGDEYVDQPDTAPASGHGKNTTVSSGKAPAKTHNPTTGRQPKKSTRPRRQAPTELPEIDPKRIKDFHCDSKLLLIVGAQSKDPDLLNLTRDLAMSVHDSDGAVIYIDSVALPGAQYDHIDIQLQADIQETLGEVLRQMPRLQDLGEGEVEAAYPDADFWFDMIQNDIPVRLTQQEKPYDGAHCCHCGCGITDYLAQCIKCSDHYCYRQLQADDSEDDGSEDEGLKPKRGEQEAARAACSSSPPTYPAGSIPPNAEAPGNHGVQDIVETFPYHEACIGFNMLSLICPRPPLAEATRSFVCPYCWNHGERGLYPHFVRPGSRDSAETKKPTWPRMAMVVYYVESFWPHAKQLMSLTAGRWKQLGWQCVLEAVKLQHLDEKEDVFQDLRWDKGTYQVTAVYITHGLAGEQGYQLNNSQALRPAELLTQTLRIAQKVLKGASSSSVFLFSCGHPLHQPSLVLELCDWVKRETSPGTLIGCMNKKLCPVYMFTMFSKLTQLLADETEQPALVVRNTWLRDSIAFSHSDLLYLARVRILKNSCRVMALRSLPEPSAGTTIAQPAQRVSMFRQAGERWAQRYRETSEEGLESRT
ncbi:hypothetical protein RSAG8_10633, partial [Rhizoctonia solani AG-8 WAC10335]